MRYGNQKKEKKKKKKIKKTEKQREKHRNLGLLWQKPKYQPDVAASSRRLRKQEKVET